MDEEKVKEVIDTLNRIHTKDPTVLPTLISFRVPCNEELAGDPTVQVGKSENGWNVGLLGILNGICGVNASDIGFVAAYYDKGVLHGFYWQDVERKKN